MNDFIEKEVTELKVKIDRVTCIASENCIGAAPELFELDEERICNFRKTDRDISKEKIIEACSVCPVNALYVYNEEGKQLVP